MLFETHICLVDSSILISWTSPFPILGVSGVLFHFFLIFDRNSHSVASDLGLHCLPMSQKWDARLIWVKSPQDRTYIFYAMSGYPGISGFKDIYWNDYCFCGDFRHNFVSGKCLRSLEQ